MKTVTETLLQRRSIRRYEREPICDEHLKLIYEAIGNTPTSYNGQQFTVVDVDDRATKQRLYEIVGAKQIKTCSHFMLFCADYNKIALAASAKGIDMPPVADTLDGVIVGVVDASLAMMSALVAAESCGLGTCCVGYARTASPEVLAEALGLPRGVFVVSGLAIGVPREHPDLKPKQPSALLIHRNGYRRDDMTAELLAYDAEVKAFNAQRSGGVTDNDWAGHIVGYYREAAGYGMLEALARRGFKVKS